MRKWKKNLIWLPILALGFSGCAGSAGQEDKSVELSKSIAEDGGKVGDISGAKKALTINDEALVYFEDEYFYVEDDELRSLYGKVYRAPDQFLFDCKQNGEVILTDKYILHGDEDDKKIEVYTREGKLLYTAEEANPSAQFRDANYVIKEDIFAYFVKDGSDNTYFVGIDLANNNQELFKVEADKGFYLRANQDWMINTGTGTGKAYNISTGEERQLEGDYFAALHNDKCIAIKFEEADFEEYVTGIRVYDSSLNVEKEETFNVEDKVKIDMNGVRRMFVYTLTKPNAAGNGFMYSVYINGAKCIVDWQDEYVSIDKCSAPDGDDFCALQLVGPYGEGKDASYIVLPNDEVIKGDSHEIEFDDGGRYGIYHMSDDNYYVYANGKSFKTPYDISGPEIINDTAIFWEDYKYIAYDLDGNKVVETQGEKILSMPVIDGTTYICSIEDGKLVQYNCTTGAKEELCDIEADIDFETKYISTKRGFSDYMYPSLTLIPYINKENGEIHVVNIEKKTNKVVGKASTGAKINTVGVIGFSVVDGDTTDVYCYQ